MLTNTPRFIAIEGNIGAGKSGLLMAASHAFGHKTVLLPEPLHLWTSYYSGRTDHMHNFLQKYYKEPRAAFAFQTFAMNSMMKQVAKALEDIGDTDKFILMERGPLSCLQVCSRAHTL